MKFEELLIKASLEAGKEILEVYAKEFSVEDKEDKSPLTEADKRSHLAIMKHLEGTGLPILSEEGKHMDFATRKDWKQFWLVDPLDGTKEFVKKNGEFTVNIALIHKDTPVLGIVYAPALDICYWAKKNEGAFKDGKILPLKTENQRETYKNNRFVMPRKDTNKIFNMFKGKAL